MKYTVFGLVDAAGKSLPAVEVEANSNTEAKMLAAEQSGGYWNENTETTHLASSDELAVRVEWLEAELARTIMRANGYIDELEIRNRSLEAGEAISQLEDDLRRLRSLVAWQPLDDCAISDDRVTLTLYGPLLNGLVDNDAVFIFTLPDGVRLCRRVD